MSGADTWTRVNDLFHRALELAAADRAAFLETACEGDDALRNDVASLLAAHDQAAEFIERPAAEPSDLLALGLAPAHRLVGRELGHYRIDGVLGEGGMGVVYLAEDTRLGRPVALKAVAPAFTQNPDSRDRLRREARAAAALTHPGIATVYALEQFDDDLYIAFEFVPGETLRTELRRGPLPVPVAIDTALGIARALAAAHDRGIIHRDLKPENVIRTPTRELKILDFGLARFREPLASTATLTAGGVVIGTPAYMSPEQIRSETVDGRSDLFSLGAMLYELVSGVSPFLGADHAATIVNVLEMQPPRLVTQIGSGPEAARLAALEDLIFVCLRKSANARLQSAHDLVRALEALRPGDGHRVPSTPVSLPAPAAAMPRQEDARWWWKFHQAAASATYLALLIPLWLVHEWRAGLPGLILFLAGLVAALVASTLRLHLWFTVRSYPEEWTAQRRSTGGWIQVADVAFVTVLLVAASLVLTLHASAAVVLVGAAVAVVLSFTVIEPATTRAAFGPR